MFTFVRKHIQNNMVGWIALFIALTGTSYAAVKLGNGSVKSANIAKNAVVSSKVKDSSLQAKDFNAQALQSLKSVGNEGPQGQQGPQGAQGQQGPTGTVGKQGTSGISDYELIYQMSNADSPTSLTTVVKCQKGKVPLGRPAFHIGATTYNGERYVDVTEVDPIMDAGTQSGWTIKAEELSNVTENWRLYLYLTCAKVA